jgi:hypothetical protein
MSYGEGGTPSTPAVYSSVTVATQWSTAYLISLTGVLRRWNASVSLLRLPSAVMAAPGALIAVISTFTPHVLTILYYDYHTIRLY